MVHSIRLVEFRLDPQKMLEHYNTKFLPILGKGDPLAIKLTRDSHVEDLVFSSWVLGTVYIKL